MVDLDIRLSVAGDLAVDVEAEGAAADFDMVLGYNMGGGGGADLQTKSVTYTPTTAEQTDSVHADLGYDGLSRVNVTVGAMPAGTAGTPTAAKGAVSGHSVAVTPSVTNSAGYIAGGTETGAPVTVSAAELVDGTLSITANGPYDVTNYAGATVSVSAPTPALQSKTATPTEQQQTVTADSGYDGLSSVTVDAIDAGYVGSGVTRRTSSSLTASGATVTAPAGYYASAASKSVASGSATPAASISATGASVSTGTNTLTLSKTVSNTPQVSAGYIGSGTAGNSSVSLTASVTTKAAATITPSTSAQTIAAGTYLTGAQTIAAMPAGTAGTPTASKGAVSNHSVSVTPSVTNTTGYITGGTKTGTAVTVSASELVSGTKSITENGTGIDVANYSAVDVSVASGGGNDFIITVSWNDSTQLWEPDCTVYEWWDAYTGGKTIAIECSDGSAVNWFCDDDYVFVYIVYAWDGNSLIGSDYIFSVDGVEHGMDTETIVPVFDSPTRTYTPTTSQQTETITFDPSSYNGIQQVGVTVNAMPTGTAGTPTASKGTVSNHAITVTPTVTNTAGYISGGTINGTGVSVSASELVSGTLSITSSGTKDVTNYASASVSAMTLPTATSSTPSGTSKLAVTPGTAAKYINIPTGYNSAAAYYTVNGDANLVAGNIKSGTTIFGVQGTYSGGGSSKNVQVQQSTTRSTSTSGTQVISLTCTTAGTYDVYWTTFRSSTSGTWGSRLYIGGTAYETMDTGDWTNHVQNRHVANVSIGANQAVAVYVQSRGSNYYGYVGTLTIVQSS